VVYLLIAAFGLFLCCGFAWQAVKIWVLPAEPIDRHVAAPGPGCGDRYIPHANAGYKDRWEGYSSGASVTCARDHSVLSDTGYGGPDVVYTVVSNTDNNACRMWQTTGSATWRCR
jgi:hypothetical protein